MDSSTVEFQSKFSRRQEAVVSAFTKIGYKVMYSRNGIPCIDRDKKEVYLPLVNDDDLPTVIKTIRSWVDHEMAHELAGSDKELLMKAIKIGKSMEKIFRKIEDGRVEKIESELFVGCSENLEWGEKYFVDEKKNRNVGIALYLLAKRGIGNLEEREMLDFVKPLSKKAIGLATNCRTCQEAYDASLIVYKDLKGDAEDKAREELEKKKKEEKKKEKEEKERKERKEKDDKEKKSGKSKRGQPDDSDGDEGEDGECDDSGDEEGENKESKSKKKKSGERKERDSDTESEKSSSGENNEDEDGDEKDASDGNEDDGNSNENSDFLDKDDKGSKGDKDDNESDDKGDDNEDNSDVDDSENDDNDGDKESAEPRLTDDEKEEIEKCAKEQAEDELEEEASEWDELSEKIVEALSDEISEAKKSRENSEYIPFTKYDTVVDLTIPSERRWGYSGVGSIFEGVEKDVNVLSQRLRLELLATKLLRDRYKEKGFLDQRRLHTLGMHTDQRNVFYNRVKKEGLNTAVIFLIDSSASMRGDKFTLACKTGYLLSMTMEILSIPSEMLSFTQDSHSPSYPEYGNGFAKGYSRYMPLRHFVHKSFDKRVKHCMGAINTLGQVCEQNADGESVIWAASRLLKRKEQRKILFVLSDGSPCNSESCNLDDHLKSAVKMITKAGIECVGIGMNSDAVSEYYPNHVVINDLSDLIHGAFEKVAQSIRGAKASVVR